VLSSRGDLSSQAPPSWKNKKKGRCPIAPETDSFGKTVLLVDSDQKLGEMRARRLRLYGITVHTASSIEAARISLGGHNYHLVLLAAHENPEEALAFRREIRRHNPKQRVAFLVGPPLYLSFTYGENVIPMRLPSSNRADRLTGHLASA